MTPFGIVEVGFPDLKRSAITDAKGAFEIANLPAGSAQAQIRRLGYRVVDMRFTFAAGDTLDRRIILSSTAATLDSMRITAARPSSLIPSFEENRKAGLGHFFTREELEKHGQGPLGGMLATLPGLTMARGTTDQLWVLSKRMPASLCHSPIAKQQKDCLNGQGVYVPEDFEIRQLRMPVGCYAQVYLDDVLMNRTRPTEPFDVNRIPVDQLEAVEWYAGASQLPMKYSGLDARCGVLVLWTRRAR